MSVVEESNLFDQIAAVLRVNVAQRAIFISERFGYVYVANQKAACSTTKLALYRAELDDPDYTPSSVHDRSLNPIAQPKDIPPTQFELLMTGVAFRFTFVRNPYTRLLSVYRDKVEGQAVNQLQDPTSVVGRPYHEQLAQRFQIDTGTLAKLSFGDFVGLIEKEEPERMDAHWRPQSINTCLGLVDYDFVGRVETFDSDMTMIADRLGFQYSPLPRYNRTGADDAVEMYYTQELADRVYAKFRSDFDEFGYGRQLPASNE